MSGKAIDDKQCTLLFMYAGQKDWSGQSMSQQVAYQAPSGVCNYPFFKFNDYLNIYPGYQPPDAPTVVFKCTVIVTYSDNTKKKGDQNTLFANLHDIISVDLTDVGGAVPAPPPIKPGEVLYSITDQLPDNWKVTSIVEPPAGEGPKTVTPMHSGLTLTYKIDPNGTHCAVLLSEDEQVSSQPYLQFSGGELRVTWGWAPGYMDNVIMRVIVTPYGAKESIAHDITPNSNTWVCPASLNNGGKVSVTMMLK
jgi:hypothetical protein